VKMKRFIRYTTVAALMGALALAAATPSEARNGRNAAAIGFGVGALAGAAIASPATRMTFTATNNFSIDSQR